MEYKDYYKTLGLSKSATEKEIKAAYRRLARKYHPDVNQGKAQAEARFKEINEAYEVLSDPKKRRRYDELGADWKSYAQTPPAQGPFGRGRVRVNLGGLGDFSDFFQTFFAGMRGGGWPREAGDQVGAPFNIPLRQDHEQEVEISLAEALKGGKRILRGAGSREVEVRIPPGMRDGSRIRVAGEAAGLGAGGGDLYLKVRLRPEAGFSVDGDHIAATIAVPLTTAVLGGEVDVVTLDGRVALKIPAGTPSGRVFRVKGHGLPRAGQAGRGDLLVSVGVSVPSTLTRREREIFEELKRLGH